MLRSLTLAMVLSCVVACGKEEASPTAPSPNTQPPGSPPTRTLRASGTVVEIQGGPVADAAVILARCGAPPPEDNILARTLTDASGRFALTHEAAAATPNACFFLWIERDGYVPFPWYDSRSMEGITIRLQRLRRVAGRVVEVDGAPLSRVNVTPFAYHRTGPSTFTDGTGSFVMNDVGGLLKFEKGGYVQRLVTIPEGHDVDLDVVHIQPTIVVSGASSLASRISSADLEYDFSWWGGQWEMTSCNPCKQIELETEQRELEIRLQWSGNTPLHLWVASGDDGNLGRAAAQPGESRLTMPVDAAASIMYVGVPNSAGAPPTLHEPVTFELTTVVR